MPPPPSPPQCIDLTGDDDNVISIAAPAPSRGPANGTYALPTVVNGHRHHGRPSHPITGDHNRSAKRVKLSKPDTEPLLRLSEPIQHYAGQCIDEGARDHPWVNRVDLDRKVRESQTLSDEEKESSERLKRNVLITGCGRFASKIWLDLAT